ncbi:MAG: DUF2191 domain-containing protein [Planctomycetes bacterium]|nr:DUF2191 domain-containing protein [Planctomycetota bacterium]
MRTTVNLDDHLLRQARELAAKSGRTLTSMLEDALREVLSRSTQEPRRKRVKLPVSHRAPGVRPGVDLDSSASLLDIMEHRGAAS